MKKFRFSERDAKRIESALKSLENNTLSELSSEFVIGGGNCPGGSTWAKSKHTNSA